MKIKSGFVKRDIAGTTIVVSVGKNAPFNGTIHLNDTASFMWDCFQNDITVDECEKLVLENFEIQDRQRVRGDIEKFVKMLSDNGLLE